jgi:hypothetical protein
MSEHTRVGSGIGEQLGNHGRVERSRGVVEHRGLGLLHRQHPEYRVPVT